MAAERPWYSEFLVDSDDRPDSDVIWVDAGDATKAMRLPTRAEKYSILLIGVFAIGWIVVMAVTLIVAVYISRH